MISVVNMFGSFSGGLNVPAERWKEIMDAANKQTNELNADYEYECANKKVSPSSQLTVKSA